MNVFHHFCSELANLIVLSHFYFSAVCNEYVHAILVSQGGQVPLHVKNFAAQGFFFYVFSTSIVLPIMVSIFWSMLYTFTTIFINLKFKFFFFWWIHSKFRIHANYVPPNIVTFQSARAVTTSVCFPPSLSDHTRSTGPRNHDRPHSPALQLCQTLKSFQTMAIRVYIQLQYCCK